MTTRREFIATTFAAAAAPVSVLATSNATPMRLKIIGESVCADALVFSAQCRSRGELSGYDPAALLGEIDTELGESRIDAIVGLTRPSTRFLIEQSAARHGCFLTYHAHHRYQVNVLRHEIHAAAGAAAPLARRLEIENPAWARALAGSFDLLADSSQSVEIRTTTVPVPRPPEGPRHLVSWMLKRFSDND